jgi:hypothetical protein
MLSDLLNTGIYTGMDVRCAFGGQTGNGAANIYGDGQLILNSTAVHELNKVCPISHQTLVWS